MCSKIVLNLQLRQDFFLVFLKDYKQTMHTIFDIIYMRNGIILHLHSVDKYDVEKSVQCTKSDAKCNIY